MENVKLNDGFEQVCVWPGTVVGFEKINDFVAFMAENFDGVRIQYLEEVKTKPDMENGSPVSGTGDRNDLLFAVHKGDVGKFAIPRLTVGIRWIEDIYGNGHGDLYDKRIVQYMSWTGYKERYAL